MCNFVKNKQLQKKISQWYYVLSNSSAISVAIEIAVEYKGLDFRYRCGIQ